MVALREDDSPLAAAKRLIRDYGLHDNGYPVSLDELNELFIPIVDDHPDASDYALRPSGGGPITLERPAYVILKKRSWDYPQHVRYAHEVGHALLSHFGSYRAVEVDPWFHDRQERDAWTIAAVLLIPHRLLYESAFWGWSKQHIAAACDVPLKLVDLYPK